MSDYYGSPRSDYGGSDDYYGYDLGYAERKFGRSCDSATRLLESAQDDDTPNLDVGVIYQGNYGSLMINTPPQFDGFCDALERFPSHRVIDSLKFHHFKMYPGTIKKIESAIKTKQIKHLEIERCFQDSFQSRTKAENFVSGYLETNQTLEKLTVDCGILNRRFSNAVRDHPTLDKVEIVNLSFREEEFTSFIEGVKDMSEVTIRREWPRCEENEMKILHLIPPVLATNPQLKKLHLRGAETVNLGSRCQRGHEYDDAHAFAQALSTNSNLKHFILAGTNREVRNILLKAIYDDTSLNSVAMSNHTCLISIDSGDSWGEKYKCLARDYEWSQGGEVSLARKSKLLCAAGTFKEDCINIHHFTGVPLALIPDVVEFIGDLTAFEGFEDTEELARLAFKNVFELMRNVVAPLLPTHGKSGLKRKRNDA